MSSQLVSNITHGIQNGSSVGSSPRIKFRTKPYLTSNNELTITYNKMSKQQLGDLKISHSGCLVCSVSSSRLPNTFTQQWLEIIFDTLVKCAHDMLSEIHTSIFHGTCMGFQVMQRPSSLYEPVFLADVVSLSEFPLEVTPVENTTDDLDSIKEIMDSMATRNSLLGLVRC